MRYPVCDCLSSSCAPGLYTVFQSVRTKEAVFYHVNLSLGNQTLPRLNSCRSLLSGQRSSQTLPRVNFCCSLLSGLRPRRSLGSLPPTSLVIEPITRLFRLHLKAGLTDKPPGGDFVSTETLEQEQLVSKEGH